MTSPGLLKAVVKRSLEVVYSHKIESISQFQSTLRNNDSSQPKISKPIDAILIAGDFVKPDFKAQDNGGIEYKFAALKELISKIVVSIQEVYPGVPILPAVGETDNLFYYMVPDTEKIEELIYSSLYEAWFPEKCAALKNKTRIF